MPYGRRYYSSRKRYGRRNFRSRKRYSRKGMVRSKQGRNIHYIKRNGSVLYDIVNNATVTNLGQFPSSAESVWNLAFRLNDLPAVTDFTNLYDQYRVKAIKVSFIPMANVSNQDVIGNTGGTGTVGAYSVRSYTALDFNDDNANVSTINAIREYNNCKWRPYNKIHSRYFYPRINLTGEGTTKVVLREKPWLNITATTAEHYGIIFGIDPTTAPDNTVLYKIEYKVYLQLRMPK